MSYISTHNNLVQIMQHRVFRVIPALARPAFWLTLLVVTALSLWPADSAPSISIWSDKISHGLAYFVLGLLLALGSILTRKIHPIRLGFILIWSAALELMQAAPGLNRTTSLLDILANGTGLTLAYFGGLLLFVIWPRA
ncbi:MAG: hypothetical protein COA47_13360 [Robiginitomaculum sp.]|nr:MAG: hypothetical protein COA47_13360 [Robiginitomaculum sp.]